MIWKWMVGFILVGTAAAIYAIPEPANYCSQIYFSQNTGSSYSCKAGLNALTLTSTNHTPASVSIDVPGMAWLTSAGADPKHVTHTPGLPLGPGRFLEVASGNGLIYFKTTKPVVITTSFAR
jgi:hypothetical protein